MDDVRKVWEIVLQILRSVIGFLYSFAWTSPASLGFLLIGIAILIEVYQRRQRFYMNVNTGDDWDPTFGKVVRGQMMQRVFNWSFNLLMFLGLLILFRSYLPQLFKDLFGVLLKI